MDRKYWVYYAIMFLVGVLAVSSIPKLDHSLFHTDQPGPFTVFGVGIVITAITVLLLYMFTKGMNLGAGFLVTAITYNVLIIIMRFILSPLAIYWANHQQAFDCDSWSSFGIWIMGSGSMALYFLVFWLITKIYKHMAKKAIGAPKIKKKLTFLRILGFILIFGLVCAVAGISLLLILFFTFNYLSLIFLTIYSIFISLAIIAAIYFLTRTTKNLNEQAIKLRDIGVLSAFFWIGASLIFMYSALWLVYILTAVSLWPLRTVCPK